jgi:hypothetical protein
VPVTDTEASVQPVRTVDLTETAKVAAERTPPPSRVVTLADDVPSADDPDFEGSHLVGAQVVQQLLGGRVIEEQDT